MPFSIVESSSYSAKWFYMISRVTQAVGLLIIIMLQLKIKVRPSPRSAGFAYSLSLFIALVWMLIIYDPVSTATQT